MRFTVEGIGNKCVLGGMNYIQIKKYFNIEDTCLISKQSESVCVFFFTYESALPRVFANAKET